MPAPTSETSWPADCPNRPAHLAVASESKLGDHIPDGWDGGKTEGHQPNWMPANPIDRVPGIGLGVDAKFSNLLLHLLQQLQQLEVKTHRVSGERIQLIMTDPPKILAAILTTPVLRTLNEQLDRSGLADLCEEEIIVDMLMTVGDMGYAGNANELRILLKQHLINWAKSRNEDIVLEGPGWDNEDVLTPDQLEELFGKVYANVERTGFSVEQNSASYSWQIANAISRYRNAFAGYQRVQGSSTIGDARDRLKTPEVL